jgi:hypothetical protein
VSQHDDSDMRCGIAFLPTRSPQSFSNGFANKQQP